MDVVGVVVVVVGGVVGVVVVAVVEVVVINTSVVVETVVVDVDVVVSVGVVAVVSGVTFFLFSSEGFQLDKSFAWFRALVTSFQS